MFINYSSAPNWPKMSRKVTCFTWKAKMSWKVNVMPRGSKWQILMVHRSRSSLRFFSTLWALEGCCCILFILKRDRKNMVSGKGWKIVGNWWKLWKIMLNNVHNVDKSLFFVKHFLQQPGNCRANGCIIGNHLYHGRHCTGQMQSPTVVDDHIPSAVQMEEEEHVFQP